ncbi:MAG TPA: LysR substrate-binding domain-containing protein [Ramlibacter sp.]|nr:LysR substrate-binding domain-containing protein [Ramlibacter sp.]
MEISHVRHFIAVADAGNMSRAAERLGIAQPALSQSLRRMEEKLGVRLMNRSRRGVTLNPVGQAILDDLREGMARLDGAASRAQQISQGLAGTITVGFTVSAVFEVLPRALRLFKQQSPDVRIVLREMPNMQQVQALEHDEIDLGILYTPLTLASRLRQQVLARYRLIAAIHDGIELEADGMVSLRRLAREGLVMFDQDQIPLLRTGVLQALVKLDEEYRVVQEVGHTLTALACVGTGLGVSLLPSGTQQVQFPGVRYCQVREKNLLPSLQLSAVWPARSKPTIVDRFAKVLKSASADLAR